MKESKSETEYFYGTSLASHSANYLWPKVLPVVEEEKLKRGGQLRVLDLGCGVGAFTRELSQQGFDAMGIDASESGIARAKEASPELEFHVGSAYDNLTQQFGQFDLVVSLEVIEHLYDPRTFVSNLLNALKPGGLAVVSTPFHGYWKNLLLAATGKLDDHFTALWDHGHIKFWSVRTLSELLSEAGFEDARFLFAGRSYPFSKSMIAITQRPACDE